MIKVIHVSDGSCYKTENKIFRYFHTKENVYRFTFPGKISLQFSFIVRANKFKGIFYLQANPTSHVT